MSYSRRILTLALLEKRPHQIREFLYPVKRGQGELLHLVFGQHQLARDLAFHMRPDHFVRVQMRRVGW